MWVPTRNMFEHDGCIEEERTRNTTQEKEAAIAEKDPINLERNRAG